MTQLRKNFYVTQETFDQFENLKRKYGILGESEAFAKIIRTSIEFDDILNKSIENCKQENKELQRKIETLLVKIGELQGELNIYKQQALPRKSFWKRLFGG
ncbi:MAG: hypothetical protein QW578_08585 [Thermoplasmatales archaeon]